MLGLSRAAPRSPGGSEGGGDAARGRPRPARAPGQRHPAGERPRPPPGTRARVRLRRRLRGRWPDPSPRRMTPPPGDPQRGAGFRAPPALPSPRRGRDLGLGEAFTGPGRKTSLPGGARGAGVAAGRARCDGALGRRAQPGKTPATDDRLFTFGFEGRLLRRPRPRPAAAEAVKFYPQVPAALLLTHAHTPASAPVRTHTRSSTLTHTFHTHRLATSLTHTFTLTHSLKRVPTHILHTHTTPSHSHFHIPFHTHTLYTHTPTYSHTHPFNSHNNILTHPFTPTVTLFHTV